MDVGVLPNITGYFTPHGGSRGASGVFSGAFYNTGVQEESGASISGSAGRIGFDASRSSNIYNSDYTEVQPKRIMMYYIVKY